MRWLMLSWPHPLHRVDGRPLYEFFARPMRLTLAERALRPAVDLVFGLMLIANPSMFQVGSDQSSFSFQGTANTQTTVLLITGVESVRR